MTDSANKTSSSATSVGL